MTFYDCDDYDHLWFVVWYGFIRRSQKDVLGNYLLDLFRDPIFQPLLQQYTMWIYVAPKIGPPQKIQGSQWDPWEFQDPKLEVLYHIRPYVVGIFHFRILEWPLTMGPIGNWSFESSKCSEIVRVAIPGSVASGPSVTNHIQQEDFLTATMLK